MTVTLKKVAQAAGVSVSVASRALNGHGKTYRIKDDTVQRVQHVAERLGFRPSQVARSLRTQKTGLIGVVVPDLANPFFASIARSITLASETEGYSVVVADSREQTLLEQRLVEQLVDRQIEALVVCPVGQTCEHLQAVEQQGLPIVLVDRTFPNCDLLQVTSAHRDGAERAVRLLTKQGHRVIGVLQGLPGTLPNEERLSGLRAALRDSQLTFDPSLVAGDNFTEPSGYQSALRLLSRRPDISALFAFSTPNALGGLRAAREVGRQVPEQLSMVTFDDSPFADFMSVPLSTICQDVQRLGSQAAALVLRSLACDKSLSKKYRHEIPVRVIRRSSIMKLDST